MDSHTGPLLLLVQANVDPEHEAAFHEYYHLHVPRLLEMPGYDWGRRYQNVVGDLRHLALYQIDHPDSLDALLGPEVEKRHSIAQSEFRRFEALAGVRDVRINVYEQLSGPVLSHPLLERDLPLSVVLTDCVDPERESDFNAWYTHSHVPNLMRVPGYVSGARFRLLDHPALEWLGMGPRYLALYELADLECVPSLADPEQMRPEAKAEFAEYSAFAAPLVENLSWNIYRPTARHWRL